MSVRYRVLHLSNWGYMLQHSQRNRNRPWKDVGHASKAEIALQDELKATREERDRLLSALAELTVATTGLIEKALPTKAQRAALRAAVRAGRKC